MPLQIIMDNNPEFYNGLMKELTTLFRIKHSNIAFYNSHGNGKVELVHAIIKDILRAFIMEYEDEWDLLLSLFEFTYNRQKNTVTKYFNLQFGKPPNHSIKLEVQGKPLEFLPTTEYVRRVMQNKEKVYKFVEVRQWISANKCVEEYNCRGGLVFFEIGDLVLIMENQIR